MITAVIALALVLAGLGGTATWLTVQLVRAVRAEADAVVARHEAEHGEAAAAASRSEAERTEQAAVIALGKLRQETRDQIARLSAMVPADSLAALGNGLLSPDMSDDAPDPGRGT